MNLYSKIMIPMIILLIVATSAYYQDLIDENAWRFLILFYVFLAFALIPLAMREKPKEEQG